MSDTSGKTRRESLAGATRIEVGKGRQGTTSTATRRETTATSTTTRRETFSSTGATTRREGSAGSGSATRRENGNGSPSTLSPHGHKYGARRRILPQELAAEFEYLRDLTPGAEADVLLCERREDGRLVVIKLYRYKDRTDQSSMQRKLDSAAKEHVVEVLHRGQSDGLPWEVQEFCTHGNFADWLAENRSRKLTDTEFRQIATELIEAIAYLHSLNIVHRDLKPANILIRNDRPFDLVLADFGLSRQMALSRDIGSIAGTFAYQPPESYAGELGNASDWWAAGVILFEVLKGRHFLARTDGRLPDDNVVRNQIATGKYELKKVGTDRQWLLLRGLLTKNPENRWGRQQTADWIAGKTPPVVADAAVAASSASASRTSTSSTTSTASSSTPKVAYRLGSVLCRTPKDLADAIRADWNGAMALLAGRPDGALTEWLKHVQGGAEASLILRSGYAPSATLVALQGVLDPSTEPVFRGVEFSQIPSVIGFASSGDEPSQRWLRKLREEQGVGGFALVGNETAAKAAAQLDAWASQINLMSKETPSRIAGEVSDLLLTQEAALVSAAFGTGAADMESRISESLSKPVDTSWARSLAVSAKSNGGLGARLYASIGLEVARAEEDTKRELAAAEERRSREAARAEARAEANQVLVGRLKSSAWKRSVAALAWAGIAGFVLTLSLRSQPSFQWDSSSAVSVAVVGLIAVGLSLAAQTLVHRSIAGQAMMDRTWVFAAIGGFLSLGPIIASASQYGFFSRSAIMFAPLWLLGGYLIGLGVQWVYVKAAPMVEPAQPAPRSNGFESFGAVLAWVPIVTGAVFYLMLNAVPAFADGPRQTFDLVAGGAGPYVWLNERMPHFDPLSLESLPWVVVGLGLVNAVLKALAPNLRRINPNFGWIVAIIGTISGLLLIFAVPWSIVALGVGVGTIVLGVAIGVLLIGLLISLVSG